VILRDWGIAVRSWVSLAVFAVVLGGSIGTAAAQYYPPPPPEPGYQPYPPGPPPPPPQTYTSAPLPPADVGAPAEANAAPYGPDGQPAYPQAQESEAYPPPPPPYFAPDNRFPPQPLAAQGGPPGFVPPADVGDGRGTPEITGSVNGPPGAEAAPRSDPTVVAALPPEDQPEQGPAPQLPPRLQRQLVSYPTTQPAGTIVIDTPNTYLYLILGHGKALRYGIGVGREGFTWSGTERISRMKKWPDWFPPKEMIARQPYLPRFMAGGESNPLGARALYLGNTLYRIHGTNQPSTIGTFVSSGCIRLANADIEDLYNRVQVGSRVVVLPGTLPPNAVSEQAPYASPAPAYSQAPVIR
jgi:lipoprotein-anchoring transpeptidase ErfK/SrfK